MVKVLITLCSPLEIRPILALGLWCRSFIFVDSYTLFQTNEIRSPAERQTFEVDFFSNRILNKNSLIDNQSQLSIIPKSQHNLACVFSTYIICILFKHPLLECL